MKTRKINFNIIGVITMIAILVLQGWGCNKDDSTSTNNMSDNSPNLKSSDASYVFPANANMYGKSYAEWAAEWWKWNLQFDCANCPLYDVDGSRENNNQSGQVFFLAGRRGYTLSVTVPANVSLFLPLISFESDYPCGSAQPAPGETIEHFLTAETQASVDVMDQLSLTIDGHSIGNLNNYKVVSPMFTIAANGDLANCFDDCITGSSQPFVGGGPFFMLKKLKPGTHTIHRVGGASAYFPFVYDITYNITQL
jgi:hypothetical protein